MEAINKQETASVALIEARISEDELMVYEAALNYALDTLSARQIKQRFGATIDEIAGIRDDVQAILAQHGTTRRTPEPIGK